MNFTDIKDYLEKTNGMTPQEISEKIYKTPYDKKLLEVLQTDAPSGDIEALSGDLEKQAISYLLASNKELVNDLRNNKMKVDGGTIEDVYPEGADKPVFNYLEKKDIQLISSRDQIIKNEDKKVSFKILDIERTDNNTPFTAIQIPEYIKIKKLSETYLGKELLKLKENNWFPNIDFNTTIDKNWVIRGKTCAKDDEGKHRANINMHNTDKDSIDILRSCAENTSKPISLIDNIILAELIKDGLGEDYLNFKGHAGDSDENGYQEIRKKMKKISNYLDIQFLEYDQDEVSAENTQYTMREYGIYIDKKDNKQGYLRGFFYSDDSALGGLFSVNLTWRLDHSRSHFGFRPGV